MPIYEVRYDRDDSKAKKFRKQGLPYSEGMWRTITLVADTEEEALEIADKRLAKQYPDDCEYDAQLRPDLAHSSYKLQGVVVVG